MIGILIAVIFLLLLIISLQTKLRNPGIPMLPGAWPIVGHIPLLLGDNIKFYETVGKASNASIKSGGSVCVSLGVTNYYVFTDPDDCYAIMNSSLEKHYVYNFNKPLLGEGLFTAKPQIWLANKKLLYPMFQQQNLNKFLIVFNKQGRRLVNLFSEHVGKEAFNYKPYVLHISLESICHTTMGSNEGQLIARNQKIVDAIELIMDRVVKRFTKVWLHFHPLYESSSMKREINKAVDTTNELVNNLIQKRKTQLKPEYKVEDADDFSPFVDTLIKIAQDNKEFHDKQILDEINTFIVAGFDTTANTLLFALMLLGHHQDVQDKLYEELTEVFGDTGRDVDKYDLAKLVYLEAFMKEVLRLYTAAPVVARNLYTDVKLKKCTLPAGTSCFVSMYGLHRNPEWGVDAEVFNPDRWLNPETIPKNPNLFAPFGLGKRNCIGKQYAMMSMKTTLSHVVRNYRIRADMNKLVIQMLITIKPASGHQICLDARN